MSAQRLRVLIWTSAFLCIALIPQLAGRFAIALMNDIGVSALVVLGVVLLTGVGGATSFGQAAFVGIAAYATGWLTTAHGASPWIGLMFALTLTAGSAALIGWLTLRLKGHFLPLSTIAWGLSIALLFGNVDALGRHSGLPNIPAIQLGPWSLLDTGTIYYLIWALVGLVYWLSRNLLHSRVGRCIRSLRGGTVLLASVGADAFRVRLVLFVIAAQYAGLAGWLYAHMNRFVSPSPFDVHASINYLLMALAGGLGHLGGALVGSGLVLLLKNALQDWLAALSAQGGQIEGVVFSVLFILLLHHARSGLVGFVARWRGRFVSTAPQRRAAPARCLSQRVPVAAGTTIVSVRGVVKRFGGLIAVNDVSFDVHAGEIVGLIGPNGAGKSTMFNLITGSLAKSAGTVQFLGHDITAARQLEIARMGLARTFQHVKLRPQMSLLDNVALGAHLRTHCGVFRSGLGLNRTEEAQVFEVAYQQLARIGLRDRAHELAGALPLATQRLLEIARSLASDPVLLILDEPAAGLRRAEKLALAELLRKLRDEGVTILIVEHDMDFVMNLVDRLVVMNFGAKLLEGTPAAIRADERVQAAYLGSIA
ncbi:MAG: branched-chain amino acid ABC transporter ATP-binding protein/permease [Betaproteobacteria bacterium]